MNQFTLLLFLSLTLTISLFIYPKSPLYSSTDMSIFIQKCIEKAQAEGRDDIYMKDLLAIKDWVDSGMYAIKNTDKTCDQEVQWYRDQQEDIRIAGNKLHEDIEKMKRATGLD